MPGSLIVPSPGDLQFIARHALKTPVRTSPVLDAQVGRMIHVKDETVQRSGSFKFRGAVLGLGNAERGVVAAGAGNFPIAVGLAAQVLDKPACLFMPGDAPDLKREQARKTGAEMKIAGRSELTARAQAEARRRGWRNLHAFEDIEMIAGSYTLGSEVAAAIEASSAASDAVVVACGGGGLAAGVTLALRSRSISAAIYVVEPATHRRYARAREAGMPVRIESSGDTICDALRARQIGTRAFEILEQSNVRVCAVDDELVQGARALLHATCGIRAEPSGALAMGAVLGGAIGSEHSRVWVIACGGNA
ncbi:pyridoxal-phosphate dependent enzyme [Bradyrhizobium sp. AUGA SZCCT0160]|uniref:pyridoxal-phosphate dependent enzyme n=1 Tax=Bradyrhizobium sp. AUGA SZCCT0160 TaxID=2807662 RepID=UPI0024BFC981|nr:pyridoxal-phosphate dependent enzyme [Bradyrhizobium sp. AUGA SZCCT0160]